MQRTEKIALNLKSDRTCHLLMSMPHIVLALMFSPKSDIQVIMGVGPKRSLTLIA